MSMVRKFASGSVVADGTLGERQIRVVASDSTVDRINDVMVPEGCVLDSFKSNPIVLFNHDPSVPIGNAVVAVQNGRVEALITFAPKGVSAKADEICGLYKSGMLRAVSVGFDPIEWKPIEGGGTRYTKWVLMEISCVAVPANPNAVTLERSGATRAAGSRATSSKSGSVSLNFPTQRLTPQQRKELEIRKRAREEGLAELTDAERQAYYALEFPGLDYLDASKAYHERMESLNIHGRFLERVHRSDFAKEHRRLEAMTPDEHAAERRREVRERMPPLKPFIWNQCASDAENIFALRQWERERDCREWM